MPIATGTRYPKTPCARCGKPIATTALAQHNHARACQATAPTCGCTTAGVRCAEAYRLRDVFQVAYLESHDPAQVTAARHQYGAHLRQAGVTPGRAQWEEEE